MTDEGELDFTTWYKFNIKDEETGEISEINGNISGRRILLGEKTKLPLIGVEGIFVELKNTVLNYSTKIEVE